MTERVYLHVGCPKSGTTYLQRVLRHNEEELRRQGVLVAGRTHVELVHAGFVVRDDNRLKQLPDRASRAWDRIVEQVRDFDGSSALPGGWTGKARQRTAMAPTSAAVRHATRAPSDRPPTTSGSSPSGLSPREETTSSQAASSCLAGAGDLRPATR